MTEKRGPGAQNRHGGAPRGERPASWDARRLASAWPAASCAGPTGVSQTPERLSALRPPLKGVSEAKRKSPGAKKAPRERVGLFDIVKNAASDARPHPEERAREKGCANANLRARVSKDEDEQLGSPSCFETHRSALWRRQRLRSRRAAMLLSMRARRRRHVLAKRSRATDTSQSQPARVVGYRPLLCDCSLQ